MKGHVTLLLTQEQEVTWYAVSDARGMPAASWKLTDAGISAMSLSLAA